MISSCLLQEALQPVGETRGFVYGSHLHKTFWGFGGGGDALFEVLFEEGVCDLEEGQGCDSLGGWQKPQEEGRAGPRHGVRKVQ